MTARSPEKQEARERPSWRQGQQREPAFPAAVLLVMRKFANKNDLWDWGVILLLVAGVTLILWAGIWVAHAGAGAPRGAVTARTASFVVPPLSSLGWRGRSTRLSDLSSA
jgi:hypothetical protein